MKTKLILLCASLIFSMPLVAMSIISGAATDPNKKLYQEDRYDELVSILDGRGNKIGAFFGVYDGHGGAGVSSLVQRTLHSQFTFQINRKKPEKIAFERAFSNIERDALKNYSDGSTAVAAYINGATNMLHCVWTGDSRLVVANKYGKSVLGTKDHKPDEPSEKERIENAGGRIYKRHERDVWRVKFLAVSRSIGDRDCKKGSEGQIIAIPEYLEYQLTCENPFAILASDGLWDVIKNDEACAMVKSAFEYGEQSCKQISQALISEAIRRGSKDNITVIIVQFDWS